MTIDPNCPRPPIPGPDFYKPLRSKSGRLRDAGWRPVGGWPSRFWEHPDHPGMATDFWEALRRVDEEARTDLTNLR